MHTLALGEFEQLVLLAVIRLDPSGSRAALQRRLDVGPHPHQRPARIAERNESGCCYAAACGGCDIRLAALTHWFSP
jgi:hypothetical protein